MLLASKSSHACGPSRFSTSLPILLTLNGTPILIVFLSLGEMEMKEEIRSWFDELGYEEGFGSSEVPPTEGKKGKLTLTPL